MTDFQKRDESGYEMTSSKRVASNGADCSHHVQQGIGGMTLALEARWNRLRPELGIWKKYPEDAVAALRAERALFLPLMLAELAALAEDPDRLKTDTDFFTHLHLLALFAEWREEEAWPVLLRLLRRLDQERYEAIHDIGDKYLVSLIASLMPEKIASLDEIQALLETREISTWLRVDLLDALALCEGKGVLPREALVSRLRHVLAMEREFQLSLDFDAREEILPTVMLALLAKMEDAQSIPLVQPLFDEGLIDRRYMGGAAEYIDHMQGKKVWREKYPPKWVDDATVFLKRHFYQPPKEKTRQVASVSRKPGRNDPCPCGSGKKYKKCCLQ